MEEQIWRRGFHKPNLCEVAGVGTHAAQQLARLLIAGAGQAQLVRDRVAQLRLRHAQRELGLLALLHLLNKTHKQSLHETEG